jgi:hypothetical protein
MKHSTKQVLETYPIAKELERVRRVLGWFERYVKEQGEPSAFGYHVRMAQEFVRFLKSVGFLYLESLRRKRQAIAARRTASKALLGAVDQQLAAFEEMMETGVFRNASPYPLVMDQLPFQPEGGDEPTPAGPEALGAIKPRPVILDTIEIRDATLRSRCLDLFAQFSQDGQHDRLDTVVSEATRYLEDRLRSLVGASPTVIGVELARYAFGPPDFRLVVSNIAAEQEGMHHLCRGIFAFIRNSVGHRLLGPLQPERVLQIVGLVDYVLSLAEAARRELPGEPG